MTFTLSELQAQLRHFETVKANIIENDYSGKAMRMALANAEQNIKEINYKIKKGLYKQ